MHRPITFLLMFFVMVNGDCGNVKSKNENVNRNDNNNSMPIMTPDKMNTCTTENKEEEECVQYYLCNDNSKFDIDESGNVDIKIKGICPDLEVCCKASDIAKDHVLSSQPEDQTQPDGNYNQQPGDHPNQSSHPDAGHQIPHLNGSISEERPSNIQDKILWSGCGIRNESGEDLKVKDDKDNLAQFGEFPWMIGVLEVKQEFGIELKLYLCGGSLIHPKVVLTAAHAVVEKDAKRILKVRAGEYDTQTHDEILPHQDRNVAKIISHENYYAGGHFNDIALLILESDLVEADNVRLVCLPPIGSKPPLTKCVVSGWGREYLEGRYQLILKKVELPIVTHRKCQKALRKTKLGASFELHKSFVCAGGEGGRDACRGDGGSPLVCPIPNRQDRYMQTGIVAWGIGCGQNNTPGVYSNVAYLRKWIDDQLIINSIDLTPYQHY